MKKLFIIHFLFVLFPIAAMSQETKIQLTEKVSINFPEKPEVKNMQKGSSLYVVKLADGTANFNIVVQNLLEMGQTTKQIESQQLNPSFWEQIEPTLIAPYGTETKVLAREFKKIGSKEVLSLVFSAVINGMNREISSYFFIEGVNSINIVHYKRADSASVELKNNFFNSLKILD
jgi:hypothetical protein